MRSRDGEVATRPRAKSGDERGAGMAEFALIVPLLLTLMFGVFELGLAMNRAQAIEAAAREGARLASISSSDSGDVSARVASATTGINFVNAVNTSIPTGTCAGREGQEVRVIVTTVHPINIPLIPPQDVTLIGNAVFRCEA